MNKDTRDAISGLIERELRVSEQLYEQSAVQLHGMTADYMKAHPGASRKEAREWLTRTKEYRVHWNCMERLDRAAVLADAWEKECGDGVRPHLSALRTPSTEEKARG